MKRCLLFLCPMLVMIILLASNQQNSVDLLEAYKIANAEAVKWDVSAMPYFITSVDDAAESRFVKGEDGKRSYWNFDFAVENTNKHFIVTVHDKTVINTIETESYTNNSHIINMEEFNISTAEAVIIAKEEYGLLPGTDWAQGYHFVLENDGSVLMLSVVGLGKDGTMSRVFFNARNGKVIR